MSSASACSLYLHVPFCIKKCGYCSFYSIPFERSSAEAYLEALALEMGRIERTWGGRLPVRTLYIGGGTPSILPIALWERLALLFEEHFDLSPLQEATVEANPGFLPESHLAFWRDIFISRVSLGVQSIDDRELAWLGRLHDAAQGLKAIEAIQQAGLDLSVDLIFGYPPQTLRSWHSSLRRIVRCGVSHISTYQLTLEKDTPLGGLSPALPDGYPFYRFTQWYLPTKGLEQYEIASFSTPGKFCRHNSAYWRQENVIGLGPSAWGYIDGLRYRNTASFEDYLMHTRLRFPIAEAERLTGRERGTEAAILELRTKEGIDARNYACRFGNALWSDVICKLEQIPKHLVATDEKGARLTPAGMRIGNAIWTELLD